MSNHAAGSSLVTSTLSALSALVASAVRQVNTVLSRAWQSWTGQTYAPLASRLLAVCLALGPLPAAAGLVASDDLFLAPASVATGFYSVHTLHAGDAQAYSAADLTGCAGCTLTGMQILPVLNMNPLPGSVDGSYTLADLAAINVGNYDEFFFRRPNVDYVADLFSSGAAVQYKASGQYFVLLKGQDAKGVQYARMFHDEVDDFYLPDGANAQAPQRITFTPVGDLALVSENDPGDNGALKMAAEVLTKAKQKVERTSTIDDLKEKAEAASRKKGRKIDLVLVGHGEPGKVHIGAQTIGDGTGDTISVSKFQKGIDPWVRSITFVSCSTGSGAAGEKFRKEMRASIELVSAFDTPVTVSDEFFDQDALGRRLGVPEPASLALVSAALMGIAGTRRRRQAATAA